MLYNGNMKQKNVHSGQILLITLLVLSIATTIALSLVARTTTDLNISNEADESSRAFNAAEAGIEEALRLQTAPSGTLAGGATYAVSQTTIGGATGAYVFPRVTSVGQTETVWLVPHLDTGLPDTTTKGYTSNTMQVCFGDSAPVKPALEVTVYYIHAGAYSTVRALYDSDAVRVGNNNFASAVNSGCGAGTNTSYSATLNFSVDFGINTAVDTLVMMRMRPLYANTQLAVNVPALQILPLQGNTYESCGTTGTGISRCISVIQNYRTPSGLFDYVIYSNQGSFAPTN
jgi:Tfp pilus assembly protein PilX